MRKKKQQSDVTGLARNNGVSGGAYRDKKAWRIDLFSKTDGRVVKVGEFRETTDASRKRLREIAQAALEDGWGDFADEMDGERRVSRIFPRPDR